MSPARASTTSRFPAWGTCCCPPSAIPTKLTRCLSTTSCWRSRGACRSDLWRHAANVAAARGGLAPWQERRAGEILRANITHGVTQGGGARVRPVGGLFFARLPSHAGSGVVLSKEKLRDDGLSLSDVAGSAASATKVTSREFSDRRSA
jgi:hypothetical protein